MRAFRPHQLDRGFKFSIICMNLMSTYYSISGTKVDEGAYVFDFRGAVEHNVKMGTRAIKASASRQRSNSFSIADRNGTQDRVTPMPPRGYGAARG